MFKSWNIADLDLTRAFDVIPDASPERSLRYSIPIPNWLNEKGYPSVSHIAFAENKGADNDWRFFFKNLKDNCEQALRIDGTGSIMFAGISPEKSEMLTNFITNLVEDIDVMNPDQLSFILDYALEELKLGDRYTKKQNDLHKEMDAWKTAFNDRLGAFLPKMSISGSIYITGNGEFLDGPTSTPQQFTNGAFITFPGYPVSKLMDADCASLKTMKPKIVQSDVFMETRTRLDGSSIKIEDIYSHKFHSGPITRDWKKQRDHGLHIS